MAEFEEKLNAILGNQQAMGQIMALAHSLSGDGGHASMDTDAGESDGASASFSTTEPASVPPLQMPDLGSLFGQIDPGMIQLGMRLFQEYQGADDRNANLLGALRPFLKEDRRSKLDRAMQIARITRLIRIALGAMGGKGEDEDV